MFTICKDLKKGKIFIVFLSVLTTLLGIIAIIGFLLIPAKIAPPSQSAQENLSGISYGEEIDHACLLFCFEDGSGLFLSLDFSALLTNAYLFSDNAEEKAAALPFSLDYKITVKKDFLPSLADRLGGVEITGENGEKRRYFSPAVKEFCEKELNEENRQKLALSFFDKIAKTGLSSEDFMFIIEGGESSLSYSVCYDWIPYIKTMFSNVIWR